MPPPPLPGAAHRSRPPPPPPAAALRCCCCMCARPLCSLPADSRAAAPWGLPEQAGDSPLELGPKAEESSQLNTNPLAFLFRVLLGSTAGFYYFVLPVYMWVKNLVWPRSGPLADKF